MGVFGDIVHLLYRDQSDNSVTTRRGTSNDTPQGPTITDLASFGLFVIDKLLFPPHPCSSDFQAAAKVARLPAGIPVQEVLTIVTASLSSHKPTFTGSASFRDILACSDGSRQHRTANYQYAGGGWRYCRYRC